MQEEKLKLPRNLGKLKRKELKELAAGSLGIILFEKDSVETGAYLNGELYKQYKLEKKDFTYEIAAFILSDVEKIVGFGNDTIEDAKILEMIADIKGIDFENDPDYYIGIESKKYKKMKKLN